MLHIGVKVWEGAFVSGWTVGIVVGLVVVAVVVVVLLLLIRQAARTAAQAEAILDALGDARDHTYALWSVRATSTALNRITDAAAAARVALQSGDGRSRRGSA